MNNDENIKESFQVSYDESNGIIDIVFLKYEVSDSSLRAKLVEEQVNAILEKNYQNKFKVLIEITELGRGGGDLTTEQGKEVYSKIAANPQLDRFAIVLHNNPVLETLSKIVAGLSGKSEGVKIFNSRTEAYVWLRSFNK